MKEERKNSKKIKTACILLVTGSFFAALKCIFVSLQMDEEYAVSMPYRMLLGDRMFTQIWDPHQTSAFLIEFLIWVYTKIFHTTVGVVIWIRLFGTFVHGMIAYGVYRVLRKNLTTEYSFYLAILYFNLLPKGYIMPEFSNMLVWSLTLLLLSLFRLDRKGNPLAAMESGIWMCVMVLAYPSAVLLFPFCFWYIWKQGGCGKRNAGIFAGVCLSACCGYLAYLFHYMSPGELLENISYMLIGNSGHTEVGILGKLEIYLRGIGVALLISAGYGVLTWLLMKILEKNKKTGSWLREQGKESKGILAMYLLLLLALFSQLTHWLMMRWEYELSYIYTVYFILFGFVFCFEKKLEEDFRKRVRLWMESSALLFLAVLILTDLTIFTSVRYVLPGVVMGIAALLVYSERMAPEIYRKFARGLLLFWCFVAIFIKGWEYRDNEGVMKNITVVGGIISEGPAKGIFTEYMQSYMQESLYEEMQRYVEPGDQMLILDMGTISYLFQDVEVASYTTICDPRYNEVLLKYWELNPEKYPDVIAVQCWYGELRWDPDSWIMQWIENEFEATEVIDGKYFRYYIR